MDPFLTPSCQTGIRYAWLVQNQFNKALGAVLWQHITMSGDGGSFNAISNRRRSSLPNKGLLKLSSPFARCIFKVQHSFFYENKRSRVVACWFFFVSFIQKLETNKEVPCPEKEFRFFINILKSFKDKRKTYLNSVAQYTIVWHSYLKVVQHNLHRLEQIFQTFITSILASPRAATEKQALASKVLGWAETAVGFWLHQGLTSVVLLSQTDVKQ